MSDERHEELHELAALFALDALEPEDRARFEEHLATCPRCQEEVDSFRETTSHLVEDDVPPPPALRESVLSQIEAIDQEPAVPVHDQDPSAQAPHQEPGGPVRDQEAAAPAADDHDASVTSLRPRRRRGRTISGLAVAAVAASAFTFALVERPWNADDPPLGPEQQVIAAQDAERFESDAGQGAVAVIYSPSRGQAVLESTGLEQPADGHAYQVWYLHGDADPVSAGMLLDDDSAQDPTLLDGDPQGATGVALSVEPEGGSEQPTTEPIHLIELP